MKTIICNEEQKNLILHTLLKEAGTPVITGVQLLSAGNLLRSKEPSEEGAFALQLCRMLEENSDCYPIYRAMFRFPAFIQEILSFAKECALYSIAPESLPDSTASERELAAILREALTLPLKEKETAEQYDTLLETAAALSPIENRIRFEPDPFRAAFLKDLKQKTADWNDYDASRPAKHQELRYAPGVRQEIEACAQEIIRRNTPCTVVLCSYDTQLPVLRQVFTRYNIPFSPVRESVRPAVVDAYLSLAMFALFHTRDAFVSCLETGAFSRSADGRLIRHFSVTMTEHGFVPAADRIDASVFEHDHRDAEKRDQEAEAFLEAIAPVYRSLLEADTPADALTAAFDALRSSGLTSDPNELGAAFTIRNKLNQTIPLIRSKEDAVFVLREIETAGLSRSEPRPCFCAVTDLSHPAEPADTLYVLGCSAKAFPGVPLRKGVFDEPYAAKVPGYPSMEQRHDLWKSQLVWLENSSDEVIWSYAASDYQGREIQPSFDVTSRKLSETPWKIDKVKPAGPKEHTILPDTARALCEQDGSIHSSVSRIERWFKCPYSWFIESDLKIRKEQRGELDMRSIGTLQHSVFEHAVKQYGKDYCNITESEIRTLMRPAFDSLRAMYPDDDVRITLSEDRMTHALMRTAEFLSEAEAIAPAWTPKEAELSFDAQITAHVKLHGVIDRLDVSQASLRILDYKSSPKALNEKKIKAGLQLQLLSYLIVAARTEHKTPSGAYYISMKANQAPLAAGKFGKTAKAFGLNDSFSDPEVLKDAAVNVRRISGWMFDDPLISDEEYKKYFSSGKGAYSYEAVEQCITELYEYFYEHASAGEIRIDPVQGACDFCDYRTICRYHMPPRKSHELVMSDTPLKK